MAAYDWDPLLQRAANGDRGKWTRALLNLQSRAITLGDIARETADPQIRAHTRGVAAGINEAITKLAPLLAEDE